MTVESLPCGCSFVGETGYPCPAHSRAQTELQYGCEACVLRARLPAAPEAHRHQFRFDVARARWVCLCGYSVATFGAALDGSARGHW